jgi:hypothetical protein
LGQRFDPAPVWVNGQLHTRQDIPIAAIVSERVELGLDHDTGRPRRLLIEGVTGFNPKCRPKENGFGKCASLAELEFRF